MSTEKNVLIILYAHPFLVTPPPATPLLDFIPVSEALTFTRGQSQGDSACTDITIIQDVFVESKETFEVMLLPNPNDILGAIIQPSNSKGVVIISDGEMDRSKSVDIV